MKAMHLFFAASLMLINSLSFAKANQISYLGMSYDSALERYDSSCVTGKEKKVKQVTGNWTFTKVTSLNSVSKSLGFPSKLSYIKRLMNADLKAEFLRSLKNNKLTSSYLLKSEFIGSASFLVDDRLTRKAQANLSFNGYADFRAQCGDSFISESTNGGRFLAAVKMFFANQEIKNKFSMGLGDMPLGNSRFRIGVEKLTTKEKENSHMEIKLYQEGGRLSSLKHAVKSINTISCKLSEWKKCEELLKNIIDYSLHNFPRDVENGFTNIIRFKTKPYKISHLKMDKRFRRNRDAYVKMIEDTLEAKDQIRLILSSKLHKLTQKKINALQTASESLTTRRDELFATLASCLDSKFNDLGCMDPDSIDLPSIDKSLITDPILWANGPAIGGSYGKPHSLACANHINGFYGNQGNGIDQMGALCDDGNSTETAGKSVARPFIETCDIGYLVTAFKTSTGWVRDQKGLSSFSFKCENIDSIVAADSSDFYWIDSLYESREKTFEWSCPAKTAASVIKGKSDMILNSFGLQCKGL